jgi:hypothetical protein
MNTIETRSNYLEPENVLSATSCSSAIAWPAIIGGAFVAVAVSLILFFLVTGLGFSLVSPWSPMRGSVTTFTVKTAIALIVIQWIASGFGGYLTGRLRIKWPGLHTDEIFFRDTAHGFLSWAVATVFVGVVVALTTSLAISSGMRAVSTVAAGAAAGHTQGNSLSTAYFNDSLFRSDRINVSAASNNVRAESARILTHDFISGNEVTQKDKLYLAQLVQMQTGFSLEDATKRVDDILMQVKTAKNQAREAMEVARKVGQQLSFYTFFSLLIGAFISCVAAALGGKRRDEHL